MHAFSHSVAHKGTSTAFTTAAIANVRIPTSHVNGSARWHPYQNANPTPPPLQRTNSLLDLAQYTHGLTPSSPIPSSSSASSFTSSASAANLSSTFTFSCVPPTRAATLPNVLSSSAKSGSTISTSSKAKAEERNRFAISLVDSAVRLLTDIWTPANQKLSTKSSKMSIEGLLCGPAPSTSTHTSRVIPVEHAVKKRLVQEATLPPTPASLPSSPMRDSATTGSALGSVSHLSTDGLQQTHTPPTSATLSSAGGPSPDAQQPVAATPEAAEHSQQTCTQSAASATSAPAAAAPVTEKAPATQSAHLPLRTFVHEVLRRSRTSCSTLQTAMCYVEAARDKVSEVMAAEIMRPVPAPTPIVSTSKAADLERSLALGPSILQPLQPPTYPQPKTISTWPALPSPPLAHTAESGTSSAAIAPTLPSPLLDPRRTFLAALILASKFLHDRAYSNKAWAKLSGLDAREIGRCERALGDALSWRLWVGFGQQEQESKKDSAPVEAPSSVNAASEAAVPVMAPELVLGKPMLKSRMNDVSRERTVLIDADVGQPGKTRSEKTIAKASSSASPYHVRPKRASKQGSQPPTPALTDASSVISSASSSYSDAASIGSSSLDNLVFFKIPAAIAATYPKPSQKSLVLPPAPSVSARRQRRALDKTGILGVVPPPVVGKECSLGFPLYPFNAAQHPHVVSVRQPWERADEIMGHA